MDKEMNEAAIWAMMSALHVRVFYSCDEYRPFVCKCEIGGLRNVVIEGKGRSIFEAAQSLYEKVTNNDI